ncbi:MAG: hypothetical protein ABIS39_08335 [Sphingomicrobium sp.]
MRWYLAIASSWIAIGAAAAPTEWAGRPAANGFVVGFDKANGEQAIVERIPVGETVERWSRMLTSQRFVGRARDPGPRQMLVNIQGLLAQGCPGGSTTPIVAMTVSGRPAARMRSDCPMNPQTGLPETFFIIAFAGTNDLFAEQVAFRRVPTDADLTFAMKDLQQVRWCTAASKESACKPR